MLKALKDWEFLVEDSILNNRVPKGLKSRVERAQRSNQNDFTTTSINNGRLSEIFSRV